MRLEEDALTLEQSLQLRLLKDEIQDCDRRELMRLLLNERYCRLMEQQWFRVVMEAAGVETCLGSQQFEPLPQSDEELLAVFGRIPDDDELTAYLNERMEAARMDDIDIEAIALGLED